MELKSLGPADFRRILTEPQNALVKQYQALLGAEGVNVEFTADAIDEMADQAATVNQATEDIGARRLHTVLERVLEEVAFAAPDDVSDHIVVDAAYVRRRLEGVTGNRDLSRYIL